MIPCRVSKMDKNGLKSLLTLILLNKLLIVNGIEVAPINPKKLDTVVLTVNASGQTSVQWDKGINTITTCFVGPGFCSALNNFPGATAAMNTATVESTITINSANETLHGGLYTATGSTSINIVVNTLPTTIDWTAQPQGNLTSASSATWTARINCVYPASEINAHFTVYVEGVKENSPRSPTLTPVPDSNCDSLEETVVAELTLLSSDIQQIENQKIYIIANASHASFPNEPSVTSVQSAEAIFQPEGKVSREVRKLSITVTEAGKKSVPWNIGVAVVLPIVAGIIYILYKVTIVTTIAELWLFSNQYMFYGSVVYGIQLVIVSAVSDIMNILTAVGVLLYYSGQYIVMTVSVCLFLLFLVTLFSIAGVGIFILIVSFCGEKEKIHIKLKEKEESKKLSTHGIKLKKNTPALFNFKVKARKDAYITLHGIARSSDCQDEDDIQIQIVLGCGSPSRSVASEHILDESNGACLCNVLSHNKYCSFYLACENNSITVMDGKKKTILQWTFSVDNFEMRDITISDIKRDDSKKDGSTKGYSTKDDSTKGYSTKDDSTKNKQGEKPETSAEWIFLFRKGDSLCEIEEHEREIKEDSRFKQTVQLICVIIFPIAWLVVGVLVVIYLLKSKGKNTDNTDSELGVKLNQNQKELSEQQIKNQNDTKGKWFDFIWFSCFHNSVKPNLTTDDNKPKAMMPGSYLANLPKGRKLPQLGEIVTQGNETRKPKKKDKKKKKIKNQDSNMNDKQQSHSDKQNITFQPEIAVAADKLEAE